MFTQFSHRELFVHVDYCLKALLVRVEYSWREFLPIPQALEVVSRVCGVLSATYNEIQGVKQHEQKFKQDKSDTFGKFSQL